MRLLVWLILGLIVYLALRKKAGDLANPPESQPGSWGGQTKGGDKSSATGQAETMLCCVHCQVYFPASEAVMRGEQAYCCSAHAAHAR